MERLRQRGVGDPAIVALGDFVARADDRELYQANPRHWAERLGLDERTTLTLIVAGAAEGLFDLHWQTTCPVCRYYGRTAQTLGGVAGLHHCEQCDHDYEANLDEEISVTVSVRETLRRLSPDRRDDSVFRVLVDTRHGQVQAIRLINIPAFRELVSHQLLPEGQSLGVKRLVIFFSDLRCSTAFYQKFGDAAAYRIVSQHFLAVFETIGRYGGTLVKTMGDGIMGVFTEPDDALCGIAEAVHSLERVNTEAGLNGDDRLMMKVGLHVGSCIVVTLNDRLDYFGQTVNIAARLSALGQGNDVVLSHAILAGPAACALTESLGHVLPLTAQLLGLPKEFELHRLVCPNPSAETESTQAAERILT